MTEPERRIADQQRRSTDRLIEELITEVKGFREDMVPIREFMTQVDAAKKASMWTVGIIAAIGAVIKWVVDVRADIHKGP